MAKGCSRSSAQDWKNLRPATSRRAWLRLPRDATSGPATSRRAWSRLSCGIAAFGRPPLSAVSGDSTMRHLRGVCALAVTFVAAGCGDDSEQDADQDLSESLFVAREGSLASFEVASGRERAGSLQNVGSPVDLQALEDGTLLVNLTTR